MDKAKADILETLFSTIASRKGGDASESYTASLFAKGTGKIAQKVGEEAVETIIAALGEDKQRVVSESADLLYHLLVLWVERSVEPAEIWAELARRQGVSGIAEKAARKTKA